MNGHGKEVILWIRQGYHDFGPKLVILLLFLLIASCSPVINLPVAQWQTRQVDQAAEPISMQEMSFDERSGLSYRISNDDRNLYVMLKTDNPDTRMKMLRGGMELQIDTMGGQNAHSIIRFPMEENRITIFDNIPGIREPSTLRNYNLQKLEQLQAFFQETMATQTRKSLTGFKNHRNGRIPVNTPDGIRVNLAIDSLGALNYLAVIPLNTIVSGGVEDDSTRKLSLTLLVKGINMPGPPMPMFTGPSHQPGTNDLPTIEGAQRERLNREAMRPPIPFRTHKLGQPVSLRLRFTLSKPV
ncbi:MAG TPA: hypothetical protein VLH61_04355 [Bacteroidales bacterium]|nr:hypothetical protein [Bacteroidales bacterium]